MDKKKEAIYTAGPIGTRMLKTAFGMLAGTLAMSGYNIVDTFFVGKLGKIPLAAMGFTFPVVMLIGCIFHGLGTGVMTTSAQALGGNKHSKAAKLVTSGGVLIGLFSIFLAVLGYFTSGPLFELFGARGETLNEVTGYMNIWFFGCATASLSMLGNNILIAVGDPKNAGRLMVLGLLLNALFDPLFIFGWGPIPGGGIRGAALATILSQCVATVTAFLVVSRKHHLITFERIPWKEVRAAWRLMIHYAVPASLGMLMMPLGSSIITWITARFGDAAVAATAASGRLEMLAFVFPMALGMSLISMIGQNYGARLYSRIRICFKFAMWYAFLFLLGMAVIYFFCADWLVGIFAPKDDPAVHDIMVDCLRITAWGFGMIEIHRYAGFFYIGCGRPAVAAWLNALRILGLMLPFSFLALYFQSLTGLFWARFLADVLAGGTGLILAGRMVHRLLPAEDGAPPPAKHEKDSLFKRVFRRRNLPAFATAQTKIDIDSSTQ